MLAKPAFTKGQAVSVNDHLSPTSSQTKTGIIKEVFYDTNAGIFLYSLENDSILHPESSIQAVSPIFTDHAQSNQPKKVTINKQTYEVKPDMVEHPQHYASLIKDYECYQAMVALYGVDAFISHCRLCAFKYIWRHDKKGGEQDLKKAKQYLDMVKAYELSPDTNTFLRKVFGEGEKKIWK